MRCHSFMLLPPVQLKVAHGNRNISSHAVVPVARPQRRLFLNLFPVFRAVLTVSLRVRTLKI